MAEQGIELAVEGKALKRRHIRCLIEALTDKYTMRSKAHKRLSKFFI